MPPRPQPMIDKLSRFEIEGDCFIAMNKGPTGYASVGGGTRGVRALAHRAAYETLVGPIPEGMTLDHLCRNRKCINPDHLEVVTLRENILRGEAPSAKAARKTHCPQGHPYDEENTRWYRGMRYCRACGRESSRRT